tara:strand:- start:765 stop:1277 length:513 start_codon:yes stop_codon:yes gene_type:complete
MRNLSIVLVGLLCTSVNNNEQAIEEIDTIPIKEIKIEKVENEIKPIVRNLDDLVEAMVWVESEGNPTAYAKRENAAGVLQIRPIMVNDVNRILNKNDDNRFYTLDDRWDREKSIEMFYVFVDYYHKESSYEKIARCWNGGPKGLQKKQTKRYWKKVRNTLNKNEGSSDRG